MANAVLVVGFTSEKRQLNGGVPKDLVIRFGLMYVANLTTESARRHQGIDSYWPIEIWRRCISLCGAENLVGMAILRNLSSAWIQLGALAWLPLVQSQSISDLWQLPAAPATNLRQLFQRIVTERSTFRQSNGSRFRRAGRRRTDRAGAGRGPPSRDAAQRPFRPPLPCRR